MASSFLPVPSISVGAMYGLNSPGSLENPRLDVGAVVGTGVAAGAGSGVFAGMGVAVGAGSGVFAGMGVAVGGGVFVGTDVAVGAGSGVLVGTLVAVGAGVFVGMGVAVGAGSGVFVGTGVAVGAGVAVDWGSGVFAGTLVAVGGGVFVGADVAVGAGASVTAAMGTDVAVGAGALSPQASANTAASEHSNPTSESENRGANPRGFMDDGSLSDLMALSPILILFRQGIIAVAAAGWRTCACDSRLVSLIPARRHAELQLVQLRLLHGGRRAE